MIYIYDYKRNLSPREINGFIGAGAADLYNTKNDYDLGEQFVRKYEERFLLC